MKILVARTSDGTIGGAEQAARDHTRAFKKNGHLAIFLNNNESQLDICKKAGIKTYRSMLPAKKLTNSVRFLIQPIIWLQYLLIALIARPDIINPHSREEQIIFTLTKPLHRAKVVWKDPGDLVHLIKTHRSGLLANINQGLLLKAIIKTDAIYTLNSEDRSIIIDKLHKLGKSVDVKKLVVIESNILFDDYNLNAKPPKNTKDLVIGTIIRLDKHKGVQYLITTANNLSKKFNSLTFWIVGSGSFENSLKKMPLKDTNLVFWGYQADVSKFYAGIDIFVQPAEVEGWGRNVKEAMYFGKPIVGSNTGGIAMQIVDGETGFLFEPKNTKQLQTKLEVLIKDRFLRNKMGKAGKEKAIKDGDYVKLAKDKILPLFNKVLASCKS